MSVTIADIEAARRVIAGAVLRTPMLPAPRLSALTGAEVFVKYENLQVTNSFKDRGALNKLASLSEAERARGVIAMSAGNHAQSVAYHAARLGIPATIVMPVTTPFVKVAATKSHGATVVLHGEGVAEAQARWRELVRERGLMQVHPYDDERIIAGQGTIALEMLEDVGDLDCLVIPIGGGGLISGNAIAARAVKPAIEIVGVEAALYPSMLNALHNGNRADRRPDAGRRHRGQEGRQAHAASDPRTGRRHHAGRRGASRARGQRLSHVAKDHGGRRRRRRACRHAGQAAIASTAKRSASFCPAAISTRASLPPSWCANWNAKRRIVSFRLTIPDRPGVLGAIATQFRRARRQYSRGRSPPAVPRRAGQGRQARRHHRDARRRACGGNPAPRSPPTAINRCASRPARPWSERQLRIFPPARGRAEIAVAPLPRR